MCISDLDVGHCKVITVLCTRKMEFDNRTVGRLLNSSNEHSAQVYVALGIIHLVIVVIPSLLIVPVVLYYIYRIMKKSGVKPVILLYAVVAVLCFTGPLIGIVTDAGTIANVPVYGNCSSPDLTSPFRFLLNYGMHTTILSTINTDIGSAVTSDSRSP